jgi:TctA family transporter
MSSAPQHPTFWLAYFALSVVALVGGAATAVVGLLEPGAVSRLFGVLLGFVGLWPLYGFIRQRRLNPRWLWKLVFVVSAVATLAVLAICIQVAVARFAALPLLVAMGVLVLGGPYLFALRQYIYKSPHLWQ